MDEQSLWCDTIRQTQFNIKKMSYYVNQGFFIELESKHWSLTFGMNEADKNKVSALLHEYIHYLQDTTTYYGTMLRWYRFNPSSSSAGTPEIVGGSTDDILNEMPAAFSVQNSVLYYGKVLVGSLLLKESMAVMAQRYVFGSNSSVRNIPLLVDYNFISTYISVEIPILEKKFLLQFAMCDTCLMSEHPGMSIVALTHYLKTVDLKWIDSIGEEQCLDKFYELCEMCLAGLLKYDSISKNWLQEDHWLCEAYQGTGGIKIDATQKLHEDKQLFSKVLTAIQSQYIGNLSNHRLRDHAILSRTLALFKAAADMNIFYQVFGQPIILCEDRSIPVPNNLQMF